MDINEAQNSFSFQSLLISDWTEHSYELNKLAKVFKKDLEMERVSKEYKRWFKIFLLNAVISYRCDKAVAISMDKSQYMEMAYNSKTGKVEKKIRPQSKYLKYAYAKAIFDWLSVNGYIDTYKGNEASGMRTRYKPTEKLVKYLRLDDSLGIKFNDMDLITFTTEVDGKKYFAPVPNNKFVRERTRVLKKWSRLSADSNIQLSGERILNPLLVSKFCHAELEELNKGGRFYCMVPLHNSWQSVSNDAKRGFHRSTITIDGNKTVELDYKSLHVSMAFNEQGKALTHDPYIAFGLEKRDFCKKILMSLINCESDSSFKKSICDRRHRTVKQRTEEGTLEYYAEFEKDIEVNSAILSKGFEDYVNSGKGVDFQFIDSQLTEAILRHFTNQGILVLPIHDSFIIDEYYEQELREVMVTAYEDIMGFTIQVDKKGE